MHSPFSSKKLIKTSAHVVLWNQAFYLPKKVSAPRQQKLQNKGHGHSLCTVDFEQVLAHSVHTISYIPNYSQGSTNPFIETKVIAEILSNWLTKWFEIKKFAKTSRGTHILLGWLKDILSLSTAFPFSSFDFSTWYFLTEPSSKELYNIELIQQNIYIKMHCEWKDTPSTIL